MCFTQQSLQKHFDHASARSLKFWRCFCFAYLLLYVLFYMKLGLWESFKNQFTLPTADQTGILVKQNVEYPAYYGQAKDFLTGMATAWD